MECDEESEIQSSQKSIEEEQSSQSRQSSSEEEEEVEGHSGPMLCI